MTSRKYEYTKIIDTNTDSHEAYNLYGIIIDATYPYKANDRHLCCLKIVDPSFFLKDDEEDESDNNGCANVTIFAKRQEDLPLVKRMGDIIRIHRANMKMYKGQKQFNVNVFYNSSWCLFSASLENPEEQMNIKKEDSDDEETRSTKKQVVPYKYSGKSFSLDNGTLEHLKAFREWVCDYFRKNNVIPSNMYTLLSDCETLDKNDFDLLCKIVKVVEKDEYTHTIKVKDLSNEVWTINVDKYKYPNLKQHEIVRIRSAGVKDGDKKEIELRYHSNVLRFLEDSKIVKKLTDGIEDGETNDQISTEQEFAPDPVLLTDVAEKYKDLKLTSFMELMHSSKKEEKKDSSEESKKKDEDQKMETDKADPKEAKEESKVDKKDDKDQKMEDAEDAGEKNKEKPSTKKKGEKETQEKQNINEDISSKAPDGLNDEKEEDIDSDSKVRFYTLSYEPKDLRESVRGMCPKCYKDFTLKHSGKDKKKSPKKSPQKSPKKDKSKETPEVVKCYDCKVECELNYKLVFHAKDTSTSKNKYIYPVLLYSRPGEGDDFFKGIKPTNLYQDASALDKIQKYMKLLTKFNIYVEGIVRKENKWMRLHDTTLNLDLKD